MSIDPRDTVDTPATDPNRGMRTRPYLVAVIVALLVLLAVVFFIAHTSRNGLPSGHDAKPASRLLPANVSHAAHPRGRA